MSRKRKRKVHSRNTGAKNTGFPFTLAGTLLFVGSAALFYLWLGGRCEALGTEIKNLEKHYSEVQDRRRVEEIKWAAMTTLPGVEQALIRHGLEMRFPDKRHIVEVPASLYAGGLDESSLALHDDAHGRSRVAMND
ncbi:MAG TPA: hypothetical protein PKM67_07705 [Kiritimatiellia bacterium]|nr:hypothetical protein [Kiritimatiellia bacterium]HNR94069.1 hypothetical protein [Kiritimatiellia bacterium]HNS81326.1 hypothetical protein [Kiritimatiellia bacterium]HPA78030.1 hypothetical protein [Kiritimatiellia bacterium]HQQ04130.1 hypothetical protein [Kiritimatiellia bacterium]